MAAIPDRRCGTCGTPLVKRVILETGGDLITCPRCDPAAAPGAVLQPPKIDTGAAVIAAADAHIKALAAGDLGNPRTRRQLRRAVEELDRLRQVFVTSPADEQKEMGRARRGSFLHLGGPDALLEDRDLSDLPGSDNFEQPVREQEPNDPETFNDRLMREILPKAAGLLDAAMLKAQRDATVPAVDSRGERLRELELRRGLIQDRAAALKDGDAATAAAVEELLSALPDAQRREDPWAQPVSAARQVTEEVSVPVPLSAGGPPDPAGTLLGRGRTSAPERGSELPIQRTRGSWGGG